LTTDKRIPINAQCVIFAESEVVGLIHAKTPTNEISKAIHDSMASRIGSIIRRIGVNDDVVLVGGVAHNPGFLAALKCELKLDRIRVPEYPEFIAAIGAALVAAEQSGV
jgi:benzoyl-CoA reductase subunit D